jgi:5-(carboxyamino)imidazole ribonucleotide synthase
LRAIAGWPLGAARRTGEIEMRNLVGDEANAWRDILAEPGQHLHLYGKPEARPGRKMGHVTRVWPAKTDQCATTEPGLKSDSGQ